MKRLAILASLILGLCVPAAHAARYNAMGCEYQGADDNGEFTVTGTGMSCDTSIFWSGAAALRVNVTTTQSSNKVALWSTTAGTIARMDLVSATSADVYASGYFYVTTLPSADVDIVQLDSSADARVCGINLSTAGVITAVNAAGTSVGTGPTITTGKWWFVNLRCTVHATTATVTLQMSPALAGITRRPVTYVSVTNANTGSTNIDEIAFGTVSGSATADLYFDDWRTDSAAFPGPGRISLLQAGANGTYTAWTNDCTNVDEIPADTVAVITETTTSEIESCATTDQTLLNGESISTVWGSIMSVTRSAGAGSPTAAIIVRDSGDQTSTTSVALTGTARAFTTQYTADSGAAAWTDSSIDALQLGVKAVDASSSTESVDGISGYVDIAQTARSNQL